MQAFSILHFQFFMGVIRLELYIDVDYESLNKFGEELCGDKVEVLRNNESVIVVLSDGLGSGVKANILATMTIKIIGTLMMNGAPIEEAVETIASTLPVCNERGLAYSTFTILQVFNSGEAYLVEFDNPSAFFMRRGRNIDIERTSREIGGKLIQESRFRVQPEDMFVMVSDGVVHAGINKTLNLGWQWENVKEYIQRTYRSDLSARGIAKLLMSVCDNLYMQKPGDDTTVVAVKTRKHVHADVMVGPPVDAGDDAQVVDKFIHGEGKKVVCGGTTSQIVSRELGRKIIANFNYFNPAVPPTAEIDGIDLTTEGVLTIGKSLEYIKKCMASDSTMQDFLVLKKQDGASRLAKVLMEDCTSIHFYVGRAMNPAHQNPDFPLDLSIKLNLVEEMSKCLKNMGKRVVVEYY